MKKIIYLLFGVYVLIYPAVGQEKNQQPNRPLQEGFLLDGLTGLIQQDADSQIWQFLCQQPIADRRGTIPAGQSLQLLPSSTLAQLIKLYRSDPECKVRLWAVATEFKGTNYWFAIYFLPLKDNADQNGDTSQVFDIPAPQEPSQKAQNLRKDAVLPSEIMKMIQHQPMPNLRKLDLAPSVANDQNFINRTGIVEMEDGKYYFRAEGFGQAVSQGRFEILPSRTLQEMGKPMPSLSSIRRYRVSGVLTEFDGKVYLLIRQAIRTFSHGNFTP